MYMAPIIKATVAPAPSALRRIVGVPVLALAALVALPWMAVQAVIAGVVLGARAGVQAVDYAGTIALGR